MRGPRSLAYCVFRDRLVSSAEVVREYLHLSKGGLFSWSADRAGAWTCPTIKLAAAVSELLHRSAGAGDPRGSGTMFELYGQV